ncbi:uncharacterized protein LOC107490731 [Arachis duranensis]|uniref:Uncharacterized protein LOC107490731 n=1 Tax=Arachis duranensis TaxID=130453 RepID=A0A6P4DH68_ARADU|nr:uncharacterized protein LOC107490731 [Arachis duranensis]
MSSEEESVLVLNSILQKLGVFGSKLVKKIFYKIPIAVVSSGVQYDIFVLAAEEDIRVLFHCVRSFPEVRIHELYAKLEIAIDSSGALAPVHSSNAAGDASCSVPAIRPSVPQVASPSFAANLVRTEAVCSIPFPNQGGRQQAFDGESGRAIVDEGQGFWEPDRVENAMRDDDSDQEPVNIFGDIDDDTGANPHAQQAPSSSGTQQYPPHFSTLNLEALGEHPAGVATSKDEAVLSVKDYSIRRGIEYRVLESDHLKYHGKCKDFGKSCSWLIRISLCARKGTWEVRRYNSPHTCLATSISSDHHQLDYHVICARIFLLVSADAAIPIKVLQQATEADYSFKPSYRKV